MSLFEFLNAFQQALWEKDRGSNSKWVVQLQANGAQPYLFAIEPGNETKHQLGALQCVPQGERPEKVQNLIVAPMAPWSLVETALRVIAG